MSGLKRKKKTIKTRQKQLANLPSSVLLDMIDICGEYLTIISDANAKIPLSTGDSIGFERPKKLET